MNKKELKEVVLTNMVMIQSQDGKVLVEDRVDRNWPGLAFPGGHVRYRESLVASAIRETKEETGLDVKDLRLVGLKEDVFRSYRYLVFLFKTSTYSGTLRSSKEGKVFWLSPREFKLHRLSPEFEGIFKVMTNERLAESYALWSKGKYKEELL